MMLSSAHAQKLDEINRLRRELIAELRGAYEGKNVRIKRGEYAGRVGKIDRVTISGGKVCCTAPPYRIRPYDGSTLRDRPDARTYYPIEDYDEVEK
jgi:hypothetical protein